MFLNHRILLTIVILVAAILACKTPSQSISTPEVTTTIRSVENTAVVLQSTTQSLITPLVTPGATQEITASTPDLTDDLLIVYTKDNNLWRWTKNGVLQLTTSADVYSPHISPDGSVVAYLRPIDDFHIELWATNIDGTNTRRLVSISDLDSIGAAKRDPSAVAIIPHQFEWIPDTLSLAFNTRQLFQGPGMELLNDLNMVGFNSGIITTVLAPGNGGMFYYAPNASRVAIVQPSKILLTNLDGSESRELLIYDPVITYSEYRYYAQPVWSTGSDFMRVAIPPADPLADPALPTEIWTLTVEDAPAEQTGTVIASPFFEAPVSISPDLSRLAYIRSEAQTGEYIKDLMIAAVDGGGEWFYSKGQALDFEAWSPDSTHFAFVSGENMQGWLGGLDISPTPLSQDPTGVLSVNWIDAARFVYVQQQPGGFGIFLGSPGKPPIPIDTTTGSPPSLDFYLKT